MEPNRTTPKRGTTADLTLARRYVRAVLDVAPRVDTPTFDRLAMSASDLQAKLDALEGSAAGLVEAMGGPAFRVGTVAQADSVALDVLRRSTAALTQLGADCDAQTVGVGLAACGRIIKAHERAAHGEVNLALIATASLAPKHIVRDPLDD